MASGLFYIRTTVLRADGSPQVRPIACLWLNYLLYWLGYVDTQSAKPELQEKISNLNLELADMVWSVECDHILPLDMQ